VRARVAPDNRGMLRLDPEHPPVWRDALTLELGVPAVVVLHDPPPWQQRLVTALRAGLPEGMLEPFARTHGAAAGEARRFIAEIGAALAPGTPPVVRVRVDVEREWGRGDVAAFADALTASGGVVESTPDPDVVVLLAHDLVHPRRARPLMRDDRPHVPVVFTGAAVRVGPLVVPGATACLACGDAYRRDADPSWPVVAAQLVGRDAPAMGRALALEAGLATARLVTASPGWTPGASVTIRRDSPRRRWRVHAPHPRCPCRSLEGIATAAGADDPSPRPMTAPASARRA